jgi:hypothetical protein
LMQSNLKHTGPQKSELASATLRMPRIYLFCHAEKMGQYK